MYKINITQIRKQIYRFKTTKNVVPTLATIIKNMEDVDRAVSACKKVAGHLKLSRVAENGAETIAANQWKLLRKIWVIFDCNYFQC